MNCCALSCIRPNHCDFEDDEMPQDLLVVDTGHGAVCGRMFYRKDHISKDSCDLVIRIITGASLLSSAACFVYAGSSLFAISNNPLHDKQIGSLLGCSIVALLGMFPLGRPMPYGARISAVDWCTERSTTRQPIEAIYAMRKYSFLERGVASTLLSTMGSLILCYGSSFMPAPVHSAVSLGGKLLLAGGAIMGALSLFSCTACLRDNSVDDEGELQPLLVEDYFSSSL